MKKTGIIFMAALMLGIGTLNTGCMGSWKLTSSLYGWNKSVTGNKYINNVIFWVFSGLQVYSATIFIDYIILNTIEFWSGSNPMSMKPGDKEQQTVKGKDGNKYEITATQNRFDILTLTGEKKGAQTAFVYTPKNTTWSLEQNGVLTKMAQIHEDLNKIEIFHADGSVSLYDLNNAQIGSMLQTGIAN